MSAQIARDWARHCVTHGASFKEFTAGFNRLESEGPMPFDKLLAEVAPLLAKPSTRRDTRDAKLLRLILRDERRNAEHVSRPHLGDSLGEGNYRTYDPNRHRGDT